MTLFRKLLAGTGCVVALTAIAIAADKPKITSQDQLPRFSYPLKGKVTEIVTNDAAYAPLAAAVRADLEKLLATYYIADRTTLQEILNTLMLLDVHAGKFDSALERLATIRSLEEKPANKYTAGLLV